MRIGFLLYLMMITIPSFSANDFNREQIQKRISPIGKVRVERDKSAVPVDSLPKVEAVAEKSPGEKIYEAYCAVCHRAGVAGAPKFRVEADWQSKLDEKGLDGLTISAIKGIRAMPPKGTCTECSEKDIKQAIEYMLPQS